MVPLKRTALAIVLVASALLVVLVGVVIFHMYDQTNYGPGPVTIEVTPEKPSYAPGEEINFTIYINNPHDWPVPIPWEISYKVRNGSGVVSDVTVMAEPPPGPVSTYPPNSRTFAYYVWNQKTTENKTLTLVSPGNYTFAVAFNGLVDYGEEGNCTFEIK
jgi:hypothetical protein